MARLLRVLVALLFFLFSTVAFSDNDSSGEPVNINTASVEALADALLGVDRAKAQAIVDYREKHGVFKSINALYGVKGIGEVIVEENRDNMSIGNEGE